MSRDPEIRAHVEWLGYLQPVGLVVSPAALQACQAILNRNIIPEHTRFLEHVEWIELPGVPDKAAMIRDLPALVQDVFGWEPADLMGAAGAPPLPEGLEVVLTDNHETLRPTYAVKEIEPKPDAPTPWLMLIQALSPATPLDDPLPAADHQWQASPQSEMQVPRRILDIWGPPQGL